MFYSGFDFAQQSAFQQAAKQSRSLGSGIGNMSAQQQPLSAQSLMHEQAILQQRASQNFMSTCHKPTPKTFREELQDEVDGWLHWINKG